jgi:hypothetical protein
MKKLTLFATLLAVGLVNTAGTTVRPPFEDDTRTFAVPTLARNSRGEVVLSWTEKDAQDVVHFYFAMSKDKGQSFSEKREIFAAPGLANSRLMRPKVLFKKDGTLVAVFGLRDDAAPAPQPAANEHAGHGAGHEAAKPASPAPAPGGGRPRSQQIVFSTSTDGGRTWSAPKAVHAPKPGVMRGFFDATVLANDEVAVAFLNDIEGQAHARDLRLVTSKGGVFGPEKILEPLVCDCCPMSLLVDDRGALHVFYRENKDNLRDFDHLVSTDHGASFAVPTRLYEDNWKINGCPHSGPTSVRFGNSALVAWYSGTTTNQPGVRVVTGEGKRLFVVDEPSAKNSWLAGSPKAAVLVWEQTGGKGETPATALALRSIAPNGSVSETRWVESSENATNPTALVVDDQVLVAYEVKRPDKKNGMKVSAVKL